MIGDAADGVAEVRLWVDAVEFAGADKAIDCGGAFAAGIGAADEIVLEAKGDDTQRAFCRVVVDFRMADIAVAHQRRPTSGGVADSPGQIWPTACRG